MSGNKPNSELILSPEGRIYHLDLLPEEIPPLILCVGDPERVAQVSRFFDAVYFERRHREFVTHRGRLGNRELMVISTGMGTDNSEIFMTELDALVNVDLNSGQPKPQHQSLEVIRIGTSGSLQKWLEVGALLASDHAAGLDTLMQFYPLQMTGDLLKTSQALQKGLELGFMPYIVPGNPRLREKIGKGMSSGNTVTCPGFYAPQGRIIRLQPSHPQLIDQLQKFNHHGFRFANFEMETAGLYSMGCMLGHDMLSTNAILGNRITGEFVKDPTEVINRLITTVLEAL